MRRNWEFLTGACECEVERCHDLGAEQDGSVLAKMFAPGGVGLMITNSDYRQIRFARISDLKKIKLLLEESSENGNLVSRSLDYFRRQIDNFFVFRVGEKVVGCFELQLDHEAEAALLGRLSVSLTQSNKGVGRQLLQAAVHEKRLLGLGKLCVLTIAHFRIFLQCGFIRAKPEQMLAGKLRDFDHPPSRIYLNHLEQG